MLFGLLLKHLLVPTLLLLSATPGHSLDPHSVATEHPLVAEFFQRHGAAPATAAGGTGVAAHSGHTNNWAVLVCTSRFWFNYRHIANTLSLYRTVKRLGIPDSNIILMLADDVACNARNKYPATVYNNADRRLDVYGGYDATVEVDYRGYEVTVENFIRLLTGRHEAHVPKSKRLQTDDRSNILVYMTGHGGDEFLKFQDAEEISSYDLADAFQQMHEKKRYNEILFMADTCQASTLYFQLYSPNIVASGSSLKGENSYSHHVSSELGVAVIDRFTYYLLDFMEKEAPSMQSKTPIKKLYDSLQYGNLLSNYGIRKDLLQRSFEDVTLADFFGNVQQVELTSARYRLTSAAVATVRGKESAAKPKNQPPIPIRKLLHQVTEPPAPFAASFAAQTAPLTQTGNDHDFTWRGLLERLEVQKLAEDPAGQAYYFLALVRHVLRALRHELEHASSTGTGSAMECCSTYKLSPVISTARPGTVTAGKRSTSAAQYYSSQARLWSGAALGGFLLLALFASR